MGNWKDPEGERSEKSKSREAGGRMAVSVHFLGRKGVQ
jgi:hypothetical protein